jgi:hypothetical protein
MSRVPSRDFIKQKLGLHQVRCLFFVKCSAFSRSAFGVITSMAKRLTAEAARRALSRDKSPGRKAVRPGMHDCRNLDQVLEGNKERCASCDTWVCSFCRVYPREDGGYICVKCDTDGFHFQCKFCDQWGDSDDFFVCHRCDRDACDSCLAWDTHRQRPRLLCPKCQAKKSRKNARKNCKDVEPQ